MRITSEYSNATLIQKRAFIIRQTCCFKEIDRNINRLYIEFDKPVALPISRYKSVRAKNYCLVKDIWVNDGEIFYTPNFVKYGQTEFTTEMIKHFVCMAIVPKKFIPNAYNTKKLFQGLYHMESFAHVDIKQEMNWTLANE